jgi:hypothetical protein
MSFGLEFPSLSMKARTVSVRVDGWQLRSLEYSMVITGSVAAAGFLLRPEDRTLRNIVTRQGLKDCSHSHKKIVVPKASGKFVSRMRF